MSKTGSRFGSISKISTLHYVKLFFRSALFLATGVIYVVGRLRPLGNVFEKIEGREIFLSALWLVFIVEMILKFFPSRLESMGCQKQFAHNFSQSECPVEELRLIRRESERASAVVAVFWLALNAVIAALYFMSVIDMGILLLFSLAFSICDMICVLFFCPFQTWIMKNKCCGSCRIYNWDYAMMFTPAVFVRSFYTWSLFAVALALAVRWEVAYRLHPERFFETANSSLSCAECKEKLCRHKKSLQRFLVRQSREAAEKKREAATKN